LIGRLGGSWVRGWVDAWICGRIGVEGCLGGEEWWWLIDGGQFTVILTGIVVIMAMIDCLLWGSEPNDHQAREREI
jgi:hypothetical protein